MKTRYSTLPMVIFIIFMLVKPISGQEFVSDPEIKDIKTKVLDVSWKINVYEYQWGDTPTNESVIQFTVQLQLWNPYNRNLVSYGSSSCRWLSSIELHIPEHYDVENYGEACTADYGPRTYPSGVSNETTHPEIRFLNATLESVPNLNMTINGVGGNFENNTDNSYGISIGFHEGMESVYYEPTPGNWGEILYFDEETDGVLELNAPYLLISFSTILVMAIRTRKSNK